MIFPFIEFAFSCCTKLQNEVSWLSKMRHQNIIKLMGYCIHDQSRFLVYELMENGSLETQLHGIFSLMFIKKKGKKFMYWELNDHMLLIGINNCRA